MVEDLAGFGRIAEVIATSVGKAIGTVIEPWQTKRVGRAKAEIEAYAIEKRAEAEAKAKLILSKPSEREPDQSGQSKADGLNERAARRLVTQEVFRQSNIEAIIAEASQRADKAESEGAGPRSIDPDWIAHFLDYAQNVSNEQLRRIWAQILANQAADDAPTVSKATLDSIRLIEPYQAIMFERAARLYIAMGQIMDVQPIPGLDIGYYSHMNEATALEDLGLLKRMRDIEPNLDVHGGVLTFWRDTFPSEQAGEYVFWTDPAVRSHFYEALLEVAKGEIRDHREIRHSLRVDRQILTTRGFELASIIIPGFNDRVMSSPGVFGSRQETLADRTIRINDFERPGVRTKILDQWASNFSGMGAAVVLSESALSKPQSAASSVQNKDSNNRSAFNHRPTMIFNPHSRAWEPIDTTD